MNKEIININGVDFNYNKEYKWYESNFNINGEVINVHTYGINDAEQCIELAVKYTKELDINKLINLIVDEYFEEDKLNISKKEFMNNISLLSIQVDLKYVEYWFDDNDIYGGHNIVLSKKHDEDRYIIELVG